MKQCIVILCGAVALLAGCSDLGPYESAYPVWSDDDSAILVVVQRGRLHSRPYDNARHVEDLTNELWRSRRTRSLVSVFADRFPAGYLERSTCSHAATSSLSAPWKPGASSVIATLTSSNSTGAAG